MATASRDSRLSGSSHTWLGDLHSIQWRNFGDNDVHFWHHSGICVRPDPLHRVYSAKIIGIVNQGFNVHAFADDLQVYGHAVQHDAALLATQMSTGVEIVKAWTISNWLRLNLSKPELIWLGSSRRLYHCSGEGIGRRSTFNPLTVSEIWKSSSTVGWRWRGMSITFQVSASSNSDNCESSVDPSPRTLFVLWYGHLYTLVSTTATRFSFPICVIWLTNYMCTVLCTAARVVLQLLYRSSVSEVVHLQLHSSDVEDWMN